MTRHINMMCYITCHLQITGYIHTSNGLKYHHKSVTCYETQERYNATTSKEKVKPVRHTYVFTHNHAKSYALHTYDPPPRTGAKDCT